MTWIIIILLTVIAPADPIERQDSPNIEQAAFDYFITKLDSLKYLKGEFVAFDKTKNKIYFSGQTGLALKLPFNQRVSGRTDFFPADLPQYGVKGKRWVLPDNWDDKKDIANSSDFIIIGGSDKFKEQKNKGDIRIRMTNKYSHSAFGDFYYVVIKIYVGIDRFYNKVYVKVNSSGEAVDWALISAES